MKFSVRTSIDYKICKSPWQIRNQGMLPQRQRIQDFIDERRICSVAYIVQNQHKTIQDMHVLTINSGPILVRELCHEVRTAADYSRYYLWISINKFFVHTDLAQNLYESLSDWDLRLLRVVIDQLPQWKVLVCYYQSADQGNLGNFEYPVTAVVLERS